MELIIILIIASVVTNFVKEFKNQERRNNQRGINIPQFNRPYTGVNRQYNNVDNNLNESKGLTQEISRPSARSIYDSVSSPPLGQEDKVANSKDFKKAGVYCTGPAENTNEYVDNQAEKTKGYNELKFNSDSLLNAIILSEVLSTPKSRR